MMPGTLHWTLVTVLGGGRVMGSQALLFWGTHKDL